MSNFEKLVFPNDDNVRMLLEIVLDRIALGTGGNATGVEHPPIRRHRHREIAHVFWLEGSSIDLFFEFEHGRGNGGCALGGIAPAAVVSVGVEVGDIRDNRTGIGLDSRQY